MGKPKASEYKATDQEKTLASVSLAEKNYFREKYLPKLTELRDRSSTEDYQSVAKGRASADVAQAGLLAGMGAASSVGAAADRASAAGSMMLQAGAQGLAAQRGDQVNVLKNARGMQATAQQGLSRAANIETTKQLSFAKSKQARRNARWHYAGKGAAIGIKKLKDTDPNLDSTTEDADSDDKIRLPNGADFTGWTSPSGNWENPFAFAQGSSFKWKGGP